MSNYIPKHMVDSANNYINFGHRPGSFLQAVLRNDLIGAAERADDINKHHLYEWASWLYNSVPMAARGSDEAIDAWCEAGGASAQR